MPLQAANVPEPIFRNNFALPFRVTVNFEGPQGRSPGRSPLAPFGFGAGPFMLAETAKLSSMQSGKMSFEIAQAADQRGV